MHDEDSNPILNEIAKSIVAKGGIVDVFRIGRGVIGSFRCIERAKAGAKWDPLTQKPLMRDIVPNFWCVQHTRGAEVLIKGDYDRLEVRKIQDNVFHVIIPA
jgi:hypothetical protein